MLVVGFGLALMVHTVSTAEPHFSGTPTISKTPDLTLTAKFKASSFGKRVVTVNLSGISHSQLQCVSPSRYSPAPKKVDFIKMQNQTLIIKPQDGKIKGSSHWVHQLFLYRRKYVLTETGVLVL